MKPADEEITDQPRRRFGWLWLLPKTVLPLALLAMAAYVTTTMIGSKSEVHKRPVRERVYTVRTVEVVTADHQPTFNVFGNVVAARSIDLRVLVAGEVVKVLPRLQVGATVKKGETLVEIDPFTYRGAVTEARANLAEAQARLAESRARKVLEASALERAQFQLGLARKDLDRAEELRKKGNISERSIDDRRVTVSQRRQTVEQRRNNLIIEDARIDQYRTAVKRLQWRLEKAQRDLAHTVLKAPFDGVVLVENAEPGRVFNANDVVVRLYDRDRMEVKFTLSDQRYGRIVSDDSGLVGRKVALNWEVGDSPLNFAAVIDRVGAEIAAQRGGIDVYARVTTQPRGVELRPGAFVEARIPDKTVKASVKLPETALYDGDTVYVVENQRLVRRQVKLLAYMGAAVLVAGDLADGEAVLVTRIAEVGAGLKVRLEGQKRGPPRRPPGAPVSKSKDGGKDGRGA